MTLASPPAPRALPIIDRPLDNTALAAYMACPQRYNYSMVQHRRSKGAPPPALAYGTTWHAILESHYKTGGDVALAQAAGALSWEDHGKPDDHRTLARAFAEYDNYRKRWGQRPEDEDAQTLGWPTSPMVELSTNAIWDGSTHPYAGKLDRLVEWNGHLYVEDHKTASRHDKYYFSQFDLDNQMMGYAYLAYHLTKQWVAGVRINAHFILKNSADFDRQVIPFSKDRLEDWAANYNLWVERIEQSYLTDVWPRNHKACSEKYGMCQYATICSLSPRVRQRALEQDFEIVPWNPLEVRDADAAAAAE